MNLNEIREQLSRLNAGSVEVALDDEFEPRAGTLVKITIDEAYWHLLPADLEELLADLPDGAGEDAVHRAIESQGSFVWRGPAPEQSRDT